VLPDKDIRRIIKAAQEIDEADDWNGDLARLIVVLAATGAAVQPDRSVDRRRRSAL